MKKQIRERTFAAIGSRWRKKIDKVKEYERITRENLDQAGFIPIYMSPDEYHEGILLKDRLLKRYKGKSFEEVFSGNIINTNKGPCYCLTNDYKVNITKPDRNTSASRIMSCLRLLYGVGECTERRLRERGVSTLADLLEHPSHHQEVKEIIRMIDRSDTHGLMNIICRWFPKSDPLVLCLAGFHKLEDFVFLDLETMGLYTRPIILFGVASVCGDTLTVKQYLLRSISDEPAALLATISHINPDAVFVTFNGRTFDIPYLRERAAFYRLRAQVDLPHFDLLHFARRAWRSTLPDCRLTTIESKVIGIERKDDVPSALVPDFYATYLREDNPGPLIPIVEHNRQDIVALTNIFSLLWEMWK
ncbi:ribonuclease H-like domain-containing protein [candidate division WOR-3 bacterium]|nr:ribonuclease H-like domain-containing protein [candidate division WOR-3 bacterium]